WGWAIWGVVAGTVFVTYARLPARDFYNVTGTGVWSGAARLLVLTGWPLSLLGVAADRLLAAGLDPGVRRAVIAVAIVATVLCATIAVPGVIKQSDLDAKPVNLPAGAGVLMALGLTLYAWRRTGAGAAAERTRGDRIALWVAVAYALLALPWI